MASSLIINSMKGIKPKFLYSEEATMNAIHSVNIQNTSFRKARITFGVTHSS